MKLKHAAALVTLVVVLSGCAAGTETYAAEEAGFFSGVWHGWIAPISILLHFIIDSDYRIYEPNNTGIGYDIGFYIAVISGFGSLGLRRQKHKNKAKKKSKD